MQTNGFRGTADAPDQGPSFAPEVNRRDALDLLKPKFVTCCDCCCGGAGQGCTLSNGIKSISIWYSIISGAMFLWFLALAMNRWLASAGFWVLIYAMVHGMSAFEGFRLLNFQNAQEYHVRGKRLYAIYIITSTINISIATAMVIIGIQYLVYSAWGLVFILIYGIPFGTHAYFSYKGVIILKQFFQLQSYNAHAKLQQQGQP